MSIVVSPRNFLPMKLNNFTVYKIICNYPSARSCALVPFWSIDRSINLTINCALFLPICSIDRSINLTINFNMNRFNQKHWHVLCCKQQPCDAILTADYCLDEHILGIMASNGSMHKCLSDCCLFKELAHSCLIIHVQTLL